MLDTNEILFETTDHDLARALIKEKVEGVNVGVYQTRASGGEEIAKFIIQFLSNAGLVFFGHWLSIRNSKISSDKTTINKREIPHDVEQITALIKSELEKIQKDQANGHK